VLAAEFHLQSLLVCRGDELFVFGVAPRYPYLYLTPLKPLHAAETPNNHFKAVSPMFRMPLLLLPLFKAILHIDKQFFVMLSSKEKKRT
jgi:hypothetical protein